MRAVEIETATGTICSRWEGGDVLPVYPPGREGIVLTDGEQFPGIGMRWNGTAFEPIPAVRPRVLSRLDFARLFTQAEDVAIAASADVDVQFLRRRLQMAQTVNLDHPDVRAGTRVLVEKGLLIAARRTAILAGNAP